MSSHAQTGNLTITRTPSTMIAGQPFTIVWSSTEPTAVATKYSCASPSGGFAGSATLSVSGSASGTADPNWLWKDSTCAWTVVNAAGSILASRTDIMKTVATPVTGVTYIHTDGLGSPVAKSDANGNLIAGSRTRYEPYGMTVAGTATPTIGFTGHVNDADTGLTYMQQRYYDPVAGRFLSTDPVLTDENSAAHFNRYTYALNNPYKYVDPDGRLPFLVPVAIFLLKEAAAEVASHYTGGASDFLSVRRSAQKVGGFALTKIASAAAETVEKAATVKVAARAVDPATGHRIGQISVDSKGNAMIQPVGGKTVPAGTPHGSSTHTTYPNGSNYQRLDSSGHGPNGVPHGHGHKEGPGPHPNKAGQGPSTDPSGNIVPSNSKEAHWPIKG